jgi:MFS family permease
MAQIAVALAGFCAFINLYSPQAVLPLLSQEFSASAAQVSTIITVSTLAVAITAPFTGAIADVLGRKRVIVVAMFALVVPTLMVALSPSLNWLIFWRGVQGLVLPPVFAVTVAYIGDEWPPAGATKVTGFYSSASSVGGFSGRLLVGILADLVSWRAGFISLAAVAAIGAVLVAFLLPH